MKLNSFPFREVTEYLPMESGSFLLHGPRQIQIPLVSIGQHQKYGKLQPMEQMLFKLQISREIIRMVVHAGLLMGKK